ncbi:MAG: HTH-type transcriptional activator IlvY [Spirochaetales bacterium]
MDLYALKCFVNLARTLHFGKAGELSNLSPSALSRTIKRIEEEVGKPLFIRDNRSVSLTRAGELFYNYAKKALQEYKELQESLEEEPTLMGGEVSVAASLSAAYTLLPSFLRNFRSVYPKVSVNLQLMEEQAAMTKVTENEVDCAVLLSLPDYVPKGALLFRLGETQLLFIRPLVESLARTLTEKSPIPWEEVPLVLTRSDLCRRRVESWFRGKGVRPRIVAEVDSFEEALTLISLGIGVGVVPELLLRTEAVKPNIHILEVYPKIVGYNYGLVAMKRRLQHPVVRAFWETVTIGNGKSQFI